MELGKHLIRLDDATLHPPVLWRRPEDEDDADRGIPWVLIDLEAYVADHRNETTAYSHSESGKEIQVTFFLARPPRVSYFCVFCPGRDHTEIPTEPQIVAMEENLVLLCVVVSPEKEIYRGRDFYIYQANGAEDGGPSLDRLPRPPCRCKFNSSNVGLLRCNNDNGDGSSVLRRHRVKKDEFIVAALCDMSERGVSAQFINENFERRRGQFALFVYNSKCQAWSTTAVQLDEQHLQNHFGSYVLHFNSKVITIGGEAGTVGFVDLWRGIILCDVLKGNPNLSYLPLPKPILPGKVLDGDARLFRDIAIIEGQIKYVEMDFIWVPSLLSSRRYGSDGWMARTYSRQVTAANSMAAAYSSSDEWRLECEIKSSDDICAKKTPHFELLPRPEDDEGQPLPPFKGLVICHSALSLSGDDDTVYFMNKIIPGDDRAWVIAVNMRTKELVGVAQFAAERTTNVTFAYAHSRISNYLTGASGSGNKGKPETTRALADTVLSKKQSSTLVPLEGGPKTWKVERKEHRRR